MNKDLDKYFNQARKSLQSKMPVEQVRSIVQSPTAQTFWISTKTGIITTTITLSSLLIGAVVLFCNTNPKEESEISLSPKIEALRTKSNETTSKENILPFEPKIIEDRKGEVLEKGAEIIEKKPSEPIAKKEVSEPTIESKEPKNVWLAKSPENNAFQPEMKFVEYDFFIQKNHSVEDISEIQKELTKYGIDLRIQELSYLPDGQHIEHFAGDLLTHDLFCGKIKKHRFDIPAFQKMKFTFRVADNNNLKYLDVKAKSPEQLFHIECYDDEQIVIAQERVQREQRRLRDEIRQALAETQRLRKSLKELREGEQNKLEVASKKAELSRKFQLLIEREENVRKSIIHVDLRKVEREVERATELIEICAPKKPNQELQEAEKALQRAQKEMQIAKKERERIRKEDWESKLKQYKELMYRKNEFSEEEFRSFAEELKRMEEELRNMKD